MRGPRVRVNGWQPGDPRGGAGWRRIAEAQGEVAAAVARGGGWMCGDLVSNHGTTGRASIERAEARPSYPILSFAWNHVGAGVVLVQTNPTQPTGLTLLRLHLRVSTDRSSFASFSSSTAYCSSSSSSSSFSTSFYYCYCYYYYYCCCCYCRCCYCCCCRYSFATLGLPPTATYRRPLPPPTASRSLAFVLRPPKLLPPAPRLLPHTQPPLK